METIREARLRRQAADRYPFIPVQMWTQATRMAELVRKHQSASAGKYGRDGGRSLIETFASAVAFAMRPVFTRA